MARILVFDNDPDNKYGRVDTAGNPVPWKGKGPNGNGLSISKDDPSPTMPVRALVRGKDVVYVGWEFLLEAASVPPEYQIVVRWWMEFYNDRLITTPEEGGGQVVSPRARNWKDIDPLTPWMRETCLIDSGASGEYGTRLLSMFAVQRAVRMRSRIGDIDGDPDTSDSLYFPLPVHAAWVRLGLYGDLELTPDTGGWIPTPKGCLEAGLVHLKVFAHVGGHDEIQYLEKYGHLPYAYNDLS